MHTSFHVSIVIPVYNRKSYLLEGLDSIASQSYADWSLTVVDDGSSEDIESVVRAFIEKVPQKVDYIRQQNGGAGAARQRALESCNGDAVAFMDSDDPWFPNHLEDVVKVFQEQTECDWVGGPARIIDERTNSVIAENSFQRSGSDHPILSLKHKNYGSYRVITDESLFACLIQSYLPGGIQASALRRKYYKQVRFLPIRLYDDTIFQLECFARGAKLAMLHENQITYRIHNNNLSFIGNSDISAERRIQGYQDAETAFSYLLGLDGINSRDRDCIKKRISNDLFWKLAPALADAGRLKEASIASVKAMKMGGWYDLGMLKSFFVRQVLNIRRK